MKTKTLPEKRKKIRKKRSRERRSMLCMLSKNLSKIPRSAKKKFLIGEGVICPEHGYVIVTAYCHDPSKIQVSKTGKTLPHVVPIESVAHALPSTEIPASGGVPLIDSLEEKTL